MIRPNRFVTDAAPKLRLNSWRLAVCGTAEALTNTTARTVISMPETDSMIRMALPPSANRILSTPSLIRFRTFLSSSLQVLFLLRILTAALP